ncbi:MAG: DUF2769 domain-containing protein [Candidatus Paceibacterota bacterium]|jgi:hypothetical protein
MDHLWRIEVVDGKLADASADAIIMTIDPNRMFFRKIDRDIRRSQKGQGGAYYTQLPIKGIENLGTFIAKSDYEIRVESDKYNLDACICPSCRNYGKFPENNRQKLLCSPETERSSCIIASSDCICRKCPIHRRSYLRKELYCRAEIAKPKSEIKYPDIIFVSDRYISRLSDIVISGLSAADSAGFRHIAFPPFRHDIIWREIENSNSEKSREIAAGLNRYFLDHPDSKIESIEIIVDDDSVVFTELILEIEKHKILKRVLKKEKYSIAKAFKNLFKKNAVS